MAQPGLKARSRSVRAGGAGAMRTHALYAHDAGLLSECSLLAGVDEVGRGPLAGNVVAACVILDPGAPVLEGLDDSKRIPPERRERLFDAIRATAADYGVGQCTPEEIDSLNILQASLLAMRRALACLRNPPDLVLVDGNQRIPGLAGRQLCLVKGDGRSAAVAAASVLAKVTRDRQLDALDAEFPGYGFRRHKGYPTPEHLEALGRLGLTVHHRRSFFRRSLAQLDMFAAEAGTAAEAGDS